MRALKLLPNDPQARQLNVFQWLWCYHNIIQDEEEEQQSMKIHLDRLAFISNPQVAKSVFDEEERLGLNKKKSKRDSRPIGGSGFNSNEAIHQSNAFNVEYVAAAKGYDPEMGISPEEFLQNIGNNSKKEVDIFNDSFEELLASGEFREVPDTSRGAGDPTETSDDFLARVLKMQESFIENETQVEEQYDEAKEIEKNVQSQLNKQLSDESLKEAMEKYGLTVDDLDIFETYDDE
ncbi:hypothetical protein D3C81_415020 [compost metagenome]